MSAWVDAVDKVGGATGLVALAAAGMGGGSVFILPASAEGPYRRDRNATGVANAVVVARNLLS
jgi:hypothetical protein